jgi:hypothetical protein
MEAAGEASSHSDDVCEDESDEDQGLSEEEGSDKSNLTSEGDDESVIQDLTGLWVKIKKGRRKSKPKSIAAGKNFSVKDLKAKYNDLVSIHDDLYDENQRLIERINAMIKNKDALDKENRGKYQQLVDEKNHAMKGYKTERQKLVTDHNDTMKDLKKEIKSLSDYRTKYTNLQLDMLKVEECSKLKNSQIDTLQNEMKLLRNQIKVEYNCQVDDRKLHAKLQAAEMSNNARLEFDAKKRSMR